MLAGSSAFQPQFVQKRGFSSGFGVPQFAQNFPLFDVPQFTQNQVLFPAAIPPAAAIAAAAIGVDAIEAEAIGADAIVGCAFCVV